ncbi:MAG: hypothetical protein FWD62_10785 [Betaproteobacteria bacterium]|nr:hypothetical protein [Betaproteobacteria bacterium]
MQIIWYMLRPFYMLGLWVVVPLFLIAFFAVRGGNHDPVGPVLLVLGLGYFALGYWLLKMVPDALNRRLFARVDKFKVNGFTPRWEAVSVMYNRYVGFAPKTRQALYIDMNDGSERFIDFDDVTEWELEQQRPNHPVLLKLLTRLPDLPVIGVRINRRFYDTSNSHLKAIFGS